MFNNAICQKWSPIRKSQKDSPLTFWPKDKYAASVYRSSFEYEVGSFNVAKIQSIYNSKFFCLWTIVTLNLEKKRLDSSCKYCFEIMYQFKLVELSKRLTCVTITPCQRKWHCISMVDYEGTTTGSERKCGLCVKGKREVPRDVRNSKVRRQDKFRRDWSRH